MNNAEVGDVIIKKVNRKLKNSFKAICIKNNITMKNAFIAFMKDIVRKDMQR